MRPRLAIVCCLALILAGSGCATWFRASSALPVRHTLVMDQLVVYSDFTLPPHHRLLEDLAAERGELLAKLNLPTSDEPIHVYLFDSDARFNSFLRRYYPQFPTRRAFFVETDTRLLVYAHWGDRVAEDLRHEVAHGYLHSVVPDLPLWLDEGLAEYAEVPRGAVGLNHPHVQLLSRIGRQGWRPNLERLEQFTSATEMTQVDYAESWAWVHWLLETDPARRELLCDYLHALRKEASAPPLSVRLRHWFARPELLLAEHLQVIAPKLRKDQGKQGRSAECSRRAAHDSVGLLSGQVIQHGARQPFDALTDDQVAGQAVQPGFVAHEHLHFRPDQGGGFGTDVSERLVPAHAPRAFDRCAHRVVAALGYLASQLGDPTSMPQFGEQAAKAHRCGHPLRSGLMNCPWGRA